ncbi:MAG TPA: G8 domain-containing protein [Planctomycetota bacterium]|nr:G8 domain-containing protein [Planctomycetota bacterium]
MKSSLLPCALALLFLAGGPAQGQEAAGVIRSASSGRWSEASTWEGGHIPGAGARVLIRTTHSVVYDVSSDQPIRSVRIAGTLSFDPDRDTRLDVGLLNVQAGEDTAETGFACDAHFGEPDPAAPRPSLLVGTPERPIQAGRRALIRLVYIEGMDKGSAPAVVCCGGRMEFQGAPMSRTWLKLGKTARAGDRDVTIAEAVTGWNVGDRVILTATTRQSKKNKTFQASVRDNPQTEERTIATLDGTRLTLDQPLAFGHVAAGEYRGDVANLSRNVVVESGDPAVARGHTMFHKYSAGSIAYAEFRHLGKEGVLGRYSLHFHRAGDTMRGSSVIGASIWDSGNRWITIHGTNFLVVRDCVGYRSVGHGFFMEDGTEVYNVLDRNLAVQAFIGKPLPKQVLPYDKNDGSGFWWANSLNSFTRNTACECDEYGYFFQATKNATFDPVLNVRQPDGSRKDVDVRTLPFVRFDGNESHTQRRHALNLGGGAPFGEPTVGGVGPDERHPFVVRNTRLWDVHWAFHPVSPSMLVDGMDIDNAEYAIWRPVYEHHAYHAVSLGQVSVSKEFSPTGTKPKEDAVPSWTDDLPPTTVITSAIRLPDGSIRVRGTTSDNGKIHQVRVNDADARPLGTDLSEWEAILKADPGAELRITAWAQDEAGNRERTPHELRIPRP